MANLFLRQAKQYSQGRPSYPLQLFHYIASKTPLHHLAWDVGTGSGQAAKALAGIYENVVATDTSPTQIQFAEKLPNIRYEATSPVMSTAELEQKVGGESSLDLVTVAQAVHWFDLPTFYRQVKWILKKPHGVAAVWCYTLPEVNAAVDELLTRFYDNPYWDREARKMVDDEYKGLEFPFEAVDGVEGTGPLEFKNETVMKLDDYFTYLRSWSAYQTAREKGVELLTPDLVQDFVQAWGHEDTRLVNFPVYLRIGRVGFNL